MQNLVTKLKLKINIDELIDYYNQVREKYQSLKWVKDEQLQSTLPRWANDKETNLYGWAIDSNLESLTDPCPPLNISSKTIVDYRNTELSFGVVKQLQEIFPYGYRWSISVLEPDGGVSLHSDSSKNITVWIPIINPEQAEFMIEYQGQLTNYHLPADGSLYVVDTQYPHYTKNNSEEDRVLLSFRCLRDLHLEELLSK
jgi:hypothetical protein